MSTTRCTPDELAAFGERPLPELTDVNRAFWTGGADGRLHLLHCPACARFVHPPQPRCPRCRHEPLTPRAVSGAGHVFTATVDRYAWLPGWTPPYVVAVVELPEQEDLRVTSNVVGADRPEDVVVGTPVQVCFDQVGEVFVPLFRVQR